MIISDDFEIPWSAIFYGAIAGIVIVSIARFVFVWVGEDPEERQQLKTARRKARDDARSEARRLRDEKKTPKEKQEVPSPSCDMVLRVPHDYDGQARCPACTHVFNVSPVKTEIVQKEDSEALGEPETVKETAKPEPEPVVTSKSINKSEVKKITESDGQLSSFSTNDEIRCPSCGQRLRVPFDKRPVTARCPRCEVKFIAEKN